MSLGAALRRLIAVGAVAVWLAPAAARGEQRDRVVLLEPAQSDDVLVEILARVRGELSAAGYEVIVLPAAYEADPKVAVETAGSDLSPAAVLLVHRGNADDPARITELWVSDRLANRTSVQRVKVDDSQPSRGATRLAVSAVELLKARLAELAVARRPSPEPPPAPPPSLPARPKPRPPEPERAERRGTGLSLQVGAGLLQGFRGLGRAYLPVGRLGLSLPESWLGGAPLTLDLRGSIGAPGSEYVVEQEPASASVHQAFGSLDLVVRFVPTSVVQPLLSLGSGAYAVDVQGDAPREYGRHGERTWSGISSVGAGIWAEPFSGVACVAEGQLMAAWSKTIVRLREEEVAEAGAPMLLLSAGVMAVF
jgi:hypothetical protein